MYFGQRYRVLSSSLFLWTYKLYFAITLVMYKNKRNLFHFDPLLREFAILSLSQNAAVAWLLKMANSYHKHIPKFPYHTDTNTSRQQEPIAYTPPGEQRAVSYGVLSFSLCADAWLQNSSGGCRAPKLQLLQC